MNEPILGPFGAKIKNKFLTERDSDVKAIQERAKGSCA
jgi:hypothetical protein